MLKLNIQRFASTNQTTHYELSQYISSDKPTYLVDYNGDMNKIDTAIYSADARSLVNEGAIGDLSELDTTAKSDLVTAINEVAGETDTNTSDITSLNTSVSANTGNIGTMANLQTTAKDNLVNAINEVKGVNDTQNTNIASLETEIEKFNLSSITTYEDTITFDTGAYREGGSITVAKNSDGSVCKVYGSLRIAGSAGNHDITIPDTGLRPTESFVVNPLGIGFQSSDYTICEVKNVTFNTNGTITIRVALRSTAGTYIKLFPCLIFVKDFGDQPE